eukprot:jgi/Mesvir1/19122/Mv12864-RA.1
MAAPSHFRNAPVAVYWDVFGLPAHPSAFSQMATSALREYGLEGDISLVGYGGVFQDYMRPDLGGAGMEVLELATSAPANCRTPLVHIMLWAVAHASPAVIVVAAADVTFTSSLSRLRKRDYHIVLVLPPGKAMSQMPPPSAADAVWDGAEMLRTGMPAAILPGGPSARQVVPFALRLRLAELLVACGAPLPAGAFLSRWRLAHAGLDLDPPVFGFGTLAELLQACPDMVRLDPPDLISPAEALLASLTRAQLPSLSPLLHLLYALQAERGGQPILQEELVAAMARRGPGMFKRQAIFVSFAPADIISAAVFMGVVRRSEFPSFWVSLPDACFGIHVGPIVPCPLPELDGRFDSSEQPSMQGNGPTFPAGNGLASTPSSVPSTPSRSSAPPSPYPSQHHARVSASSSSSSVAAAAAAAAAAALALVLSPLDTLVLRGLEYMRAQEVFPSLANLREVMADSGQFTDGERALLPPDDDMAAWERAVLDMGHRRVLTLSHEDPLDASSRYMVPAGSRLWLYVRPTDTSPAPSGLVWSALRLFLESGEGAYTLGGLTSRFAIAKALKHEGPDALRSLPLARLQQLTLLAEGRGWLVLMPEFGCHILAECVAASPPEEPTEEGGSYTSRPSLVDGSSGSSSATAGSRRGGGDGGPGDNAHRATGGSSTGDASSTWDAMTATSWGARSLEEVLEMTRPWLLSQLRESGSEGHAVDMLPEAYEDHFGEPLDHAALGCPELEDFVEQFGSEVLLARSNGVPTLYFRPMAPPGVKPIRRRQPPRPSQLLGSKPPSQPPTPAAPYQPPQAKGPSQSATGPGPAQGGGWSAGGGDARAGSSSSSSKGGMAAGREGGITTGREGGMAMGREGWTRAEGVAAGSGIRGGASEGTGARDIGEDELDDLMRVVDDPSNHATAGAAPWVPAGAPTGWTGGGHPAAVPSGPRMGGDALVDAATRAGPAAGSLGGGAPLNSHVGPSAEQVPLMMQVMQGMTVGASARGPPPGFPARPVPEMTHPESCAAAPANTLAPSVVSSSTTPHGNPQGGPPAPGTVGGGGAAPAGWGGPAPVYLRGNTKAPPPGFAPLAGAGPQGVPGRGVLAPPPPGAIRLEPPPGATGYLERSLREGADDACILEPSSGQTAASETAGGPPLHYSRAALVAAVPGGVVALPWGLRTCLQNLGLWEAEEEHREELACLRANEVQPTIGQLRAQAQAWESYVSFRERMARQEAGEGEPGSSPDRPRSFEEAFPSRPDVPQEGSSPAQPEASPPQPGASRDDSCASQDVPQAALLGSAQDPGRLGPEEGTTERGPGKRGSPAEPQQQQRRDQHPAEDLQMPQDQQPPAQGGPLSVDKGPQEGQQPQEGPQIQPPDVLLADKGDFCASEQGDPLGPGEESSEMRCEGLAGMDKKVPAEGHVEDEEEGLGGVRYSDQHQMRGEGNLAGEGTLSEQRGASGVPPHGEGSTLSVLDEEGRGEGDEGKAQEGRDEGGGGDAEDGRGAGYFEHRQEAHGEAGDGDQKEGRGGGCEPTERDRCGEGLEGDVEEGRGKGGDSDQRGGRRGGHEDEREGGRGDGAEHDRQKGGDGAGTQEGQQDDEGAARELYVSAAWADLGRDKACGGDGGASMVGLHSPSAARAEDASNGLAASDGAGASGEGAGGAAAGRSHEDHRPPPAGPSPSASSPRGPSASLLSSASLYQRDHASSSTCVTTSSSSVPPATRMPSLVSSSSSSAPQLPSDAAGSGPATPPPSCALGTGPASSASSSSSSRGAGGGGDDGGGVTSSSSSSSGSSANSTNSSISSNSGGGGHGTASPINGAPLGSMPVPGAIPAAATPTPAGACKYSPQQMLSWRSATRLVLSERHVARLSLIGVYAGDPDSEDELAGAVTEDESEGEESSDDGEDLVGLVTEEWMMGQGPWEEGARQEPSGDGRSAEESSSSGDGASMEELVRELAGEAAQAGMTDEDAAEAGVAEGGGHWEMSHGGGRHMGVRGTFSLHKKEN